MGSGANFNSLTHIQFQCQNGKIVLSLKHFEWNASEFSTKFAESKSSLSFVEKWKQLVENNNTLEDSPLDHSPSLVAVPTPSSTQASSSSPFFIATPAVSGVQPPPAKRAKTCTSDMDDIIETKRVGKYM